MLEHADREIGRLIHWLETSGKLDNTLIAVLSDNGASQEGGPKGFVNAMGPFNGRQEDMAEKLERIDDIGGPNTHSNFPWGWSMAANTPLKRYKQNTHGGGIRDPLVVHWPDGIEGRGELRHDFCHVSDLAPTLLDVLEVASPTVINGVKQLPVTGTSFAWSLGSPERPPDGARRPKATQYFEMFGHRGLWHDGWKAVAYHAPGTDFDDDVWELYDLSADFAENHDLASTDPERLEAMIALWWKEAKDHQVLPLDDRFGQRFSENAARHQPPGQQFTFWAGMGHLPTDVAPDVRSRSYQIEATVAAHVEGADGVLIAHGDDTSGYCLFVKDGMLFHDMNIGGKHHVVTSDEPIPTGATRLGINVDRSTSGPGTFTVTIDGEAAGSAQFDVRFFTLVSWEGLDIGCDRLSPVGYYDSPFVYGGTLIKVDVALDTDQILDFEAVAETELGRQ